MLCRGRYITAPTGAMIAAFFFSFAKDRDLYRSMIRERAEHLA